jgi:hypothetical protein
MTPAPRTVACSAIFALAVVIGACSGSSKSSTPSTTPSTTAPSTTSTTTTVAAPTTALPSADLTIAVWPTVASRVRYHDPVALARAFATSFLRFVDPVVGGFRPGDAQSGEVPIRTTAGEQRSVGPVTTVLVRRIGRDGSWWVVGAATPNIRLTQPAALATIASPVRLRGTSTAFEGTVQVSIRQDDGTRPLVESALIGGANGRMGRFDASFRFAALSSRAGAIVLYTVSSATGDVVEATVIRVRFAAP